jgi:hypothetical protein
MNIARIFALPLIAVLASCSSETAKPEQDTGLTGDGEATDAPDTNPDGVPYPTSNLGTSPRSGSKTGNRINNYKFYGYPDANPANGLQAMSLANFYDPEGKKYKLLHIQASGVWCVYCQKETEIVVPMKAKLQEMQVVWLQSLAEGPAQGSLAKQKDLDSWISQFKSNLPSVLDPGNKNLGVFYDAAALPWNANINAMTMEILSSGTGAQTTEQGILDELNEWLPKINAGELTMK